MDRYFEPYRSISQLRDRVDNVLRYFHKGQLELSGVEIHFNVEQGRGYATTHFHVSNFAGPA